MRDNHRKEPRHTQPSVQSRALVATSTNKPRKMEQQQLLERKYF
jgi:hypothetical protein